VRPYEIVKDVSRLPAIAAEIVSASAVALDLETAKIGGGGSVDPLTGRIRICSLNTGDNRYVIDLYALPSGGFQTIADALNETKAVIVGQNLKFDQKWLLWHYDVEFKKVFDTFRASHVIYAGRQGLQHDLWSIYMRELKEKPETDDLAASDWDAPVLTQMQYDYAADDVDKLLRLREVLKAKLVKDRLVKTAQLEFQAILPEASIELNGLRLDRDLWLHRCKQDEARARALDAVVREGIPNPVAQQGLFAGFQDAAFNIDSNDQLLTSLRKLGVMQTVVDPETYAKSVVPLQDTKEMTLAMLTDKWPILSKIIEYRGYSKNCSSFGPEYLKHIHPVTDRIHCSYFPYTTSGRYACQSPNLQQVPRAKAFRECFKAQSGYKLAICDWSNIEMRLVAEISGDKTLIKVFCDDKDAHYVTAGLMTGKPKEKITKDERQQAKPVNFGFIYGMSASKLVLYAKASYGVNLTEGQARKFRKAFFDGYTGIAGWHEFTLESGKRMKETRTIWGRRRSFFGNDKAHNEYLNTPVQGSGADGLKNAIRLVYEKCRALNGGKPPLLGKGAVVGMVHMVHDEIILEHRDDPEIEKAAQKALHDGMIEGIAPMMARVPTVAEVGGGYSWAAK
jgi:DNA polymerase-1